MRTKKIFSVHVLNWLGLAIILATGALEVVSPRGVFLSWGYIVGILLTLIVENKRDTLIAVLVSLGFVAVSFFRIEEDTQLRTVLITRAYSLIGLGFMGYFAVRYGRRGIKSAHEKALMAEIFSHSTQGIILIKVSGEIVLVNPYAEKMFGQTLSSLVGRSVDKLIPDVSLEQLLIQQGSGNTNASPRKDLFGKHVNDRVFPVEITANQYLSGKEIYAVLFVTDVTLRKAYEQKLEIQKNELEAMNQQLESFSYSVSHDLHAPLRAIGIYAEMLVEDYEHELGTEASRITKKIKANATKMSSLIDNLLTFSRFGRKAVRKVPVDMNELTNKSWTEIQHLMPHNASLKVGYLPTTPADAALLSHVITNLFSNAIKYSSKISKPLIEISSAEEEGSVIFCVADNGVGFDMEYADKLFGVFQRLHSEDEFEGTGIGLALSNRIVQKHGGRMWAKAKKGEGAAFYFSLPLEDH